MTVASPSRPQALICQAYIHTKVNSMRSRLITIRISQGLLQRIDKAAAVNMTTRSGYIRQTAVLRLKNEHMVPEPGKEDILELLKQV